MPKYDAIVAGAGVMGAATALALRRSGLRRVLLLEQFEPGHDRAASTDRSKAMRYEYADNEMYSLMVGRSLELWLDLERAAGEELYVNSGVVCWGRGDQTFARRSYETLRRLGLQIEALDGESLAQRFPQFSPADIDFATYNPAGGFLRASRCVSAMVSQFVALGGEVRSGARLVDLHAGDDSVRLTLTGGSVVDADRAVLALGPWSRAFCARLGIDLPVTAHHQQVVYLKGLGPEFAPGNFPVYLNLDNDFYGFPLDETGLLKCSIHTPGKLVDPDVPLVEDPDFTRRVLDILADYIPPAARGRLETVRTCIYAMTPDEDFIIDRLPGVERVFVLAGFSGHGFKFGPLIGRLAAALATGEETEFALGPFSLARFAPDSPAR